MAIAFPANPVDGDEYTENNISYRYNGSKGVWKGIGSVPVSATIPNSIGDLGDISLTVVPESLEIQVASPFAGHGGDWLWTWEQTSLPFARLSITNEAQLSVPLYQEGSYIINNYANTQYGPMTQAHSFKLKWIEGAGDDNLIDWVTYSTVTDSHPDINGGADTSVQRLTISVPATVTAPTLTQPSGISYNIVNNGAGAYTFSGTAAGDNVTVGPLYRGSTYTFNVSASGHPFYFTTDNGTAFQAGQYVGEWTLGVTGSRTESGTVTFQVPESAPDTLYYQCGNHSSMRGIIRIQDLEVETNDNGNFIIYGQHGQEMHSQKIEIRPLPSLSSQMCIVYDELSGQWQPQDLATYVENTPAFENKIKEVAGTATLVAPDGTSLVASVEIYDDASYLPLVGNTTGDIAYATDTGKLYVWNGSSWNDSADKTKYVTLRQSGDLTVTTGTKRWYAPKTITIKDITARVDTAPVGAAINISINKNGIQASTISIAAGATKTSSTVSIAMSADDYITVDVNQIGSSTPGSELSITFTYE